MPKNPNKKLTRDRKFSIRLNDYELNQFEYVKKIIADRLGVDPDLIDESRVWRFMLGSTFVQYKNLKEGNFQHGGVDF